MNIPDQLLGDVWYWWAWLVWLPLLLVAVRRAAWGQLKDADRLNVWLGLIVFLVLIWSLKAGVKPGLNLHLLGGMLFTLAFEPPLAFLGLNFVLLGITLNGASGWQSFALNSLVMTGVSVAVSAFCYRFVLRFMPRNFFVYVFLNGFFGAALALLSVGLASTLVFFLGGAYELGFLLEDYLPYYFLVGFSEAWISGMVLTLMLVYRPAWVATFDDRLYSIGK